MSSINETDAQQLFKKVVANDIAGVEKLLQGGNSVSWRQVIRYELSLAKMLDTTQSLSALKVLHKLMAYEIISMSAFHAAAMMGHDDILVALLDKDIPVDIPLSSGTTSLHLAAFAGELETIKLLCEVYRADLGITDKYGWSALHYSCAEGHKDVVMYLKDSGIDLELRDKDGTTGAFRAQANQHDELVTYLCQFGDEDTLLNVYEDADATPTDERDQLYSTVQGKKKSSPSKPELPAKLASLQKRQNSLQYDLDGAIYDRADNLFDHLKRRPSTPEGSNGATSSQFKSKTLPSRKSRLSTGRNTIRRMIRNELETAFAGDYMDPNTLRKQMAANNDQPKLGDVSLETLKAVMREELDNFRSKTGIKSPSASVSSAFDDNEMPNADDYEDLYATLRTLPRAPSPPAPGAPGPPGPPLPPRNHPPGTQTLKAMKYLDDTIDEFDKTFKGGLTLSREFIPNAALSESFKRLAPQLGENWKKLAHVLPIESTSSKVSQRIMEIESSYPDSKEKQAATALADWRHNKGKEADVDALIVALRKCHLQNIIPDVEKVTQEFTA